MDSRMDETAHQVQIHQRALQAKIELLQEENSAARHMNALLQRYCANAKLLQRLPLP
jgi:hypothetical protein